jgi:CheY-like chemotaxis protein
MKKVQSKQDNLSYRPNEPRKLVLCVEDEPDNRQVVSARLARNCDLVVAADDREACQALLEHGSKLSIILMDIELKGSLLNGVDLTRLLRGKLSRTQVPDFAAAVPQLDTPVLFVTAYGQRYRRSELLMAGADEIIQKPVDSVELHTAMTRVYLARLQAPR